jgi:hypothetical protein
VFGRWNCGWIGGYERGIWRQIIGGIRDMWNWIFLGITLGHTQSTGKTVGMLFLSRQIRN